MGSNTINNKPIRVGGIYCLDGYKAECIGIFKNEKCYFAIFKNNDDGVIKIRLYKGVSINDETDIRTFSPVTSIDDLDKNQMVDELGDLVRNIFKGKFDKK